MAKITTNILCAGAGIVSLLLLSSLASSKLGIARNKKEGEQNDGMAQRTTARSAAPERADVEKTTSMNTSLTMPVTPHTYSNIDNESVPCLYRHTGLIHYVSRAFPDGLVITNGFMWVWRDLKLLRDDEEKHREVFGVKDNPNAKIGKASKLLQYNRNNTDLKDHIKVIFPSRIGMRMRNGQYRMDTSGNAEAHFDPATPVALQGAHIDIVAISEENYVDEGVHDTAETVQKKIEYAIAHEIFHLIGGRHGSTPPPNPDGTPSLSQSFHPLNQIKVSEDELLQIDLPNRASVIK